MNQGRRPIPGRRQSSTCPGTFEHVEHRLVHGQLSRWQPSGQGLGSFGWTDVAGACSPSISEYRSGA